MESNILTQHEIELVKNAYENKKYIFVDCDAYLLTHDTPSVLYKINPSDFKTCELFLKQVETIVSLLN